MQVAFWFLSFYFSFYSFDLYKESCEDPSKLTKPRLFDSPLTDHSNLIYFAESEFISRDLINYPANHLGPSELEDYVKSFAEFHKTKFSSIKGEKLKKQNLPLIHDVGRASEQAPRLLEIEYGRKNASYSITLVGKGVCFDSGGLNLKNPSGMRNMKKDMAGAAAVLGLGHYLIRSKLNLNLRILILLFAIICQFIIGVFTLLYSVPITLGAMHQFGGVLLFLSAIWLLHYPRNNTFQSKFLIKKY